MPITEEMNCSFLSGRVCFQNEKYCRNVLQNVSSVANKYNGFYAQRGKGVASPRIVQCVAQFFVCSVLQCVAVYCDVVH